MSYPSVSHIGSTFILYLGSNDFSLLLLPSWPKSASTLTWIIGVAFYRVSLFPTLFPPTFCLQFHQPDKSFKICQIMSLLCSKPGSGSLLLVWLHMLLLLPSVNSASAILVSAPGTWQVRSVSGILHCHPCFEHPSDTCMTHSLASFNSLLKFYSGLSWPPCLEFQHSLFSCPALFFS